MATSQKSRCTSRPIDRPPPSTSDLQLDDDIDGRTAGKNDTYGFALAAHPGKSQGRPITPTGSQPIAIARPTRPRSPRAPVPEPPRRYAPPRTEPSSGLKRILMPVHHVPGLDSSTPAVTGSQLGPQWVRNGR